MSLLFLVLLLGGSTAGGLLGAYDGIKHPLPSRSRRRKWAWAAYDFWFAGTIAGILLCSVLVAVFLVVTGENPITA